ncbi:MAG TPA: C45 family peptidase, partial [Methanosarcina sp.]|nr:C45 family peptidase [Methanosarcina sp.]
ILLVITWQPVLGASTVNGSLVLDTKNPIMTFEGGKLYRAGSLNVVELHGSYRDMGRQYGALQKKELNEIYDNISADFGKDPEFTYDVMLQDARSNFRFYPQRYKEIIYGMAETSGLGLDKQLIVNDLEAYLVSEEQCSGVAAWGNYTSGDPLVFGRNYDMGPKLAKYVTVAIYDPDDGSIPVASITYTGVVYVTSGMNKEGVFLELNNGQISENMQNNNRIFSPVSLFSFLENSADLDQIDAQFHTSYPDNAYIVNVANETGAYSYEWATSDVVRRAPDRDGLLVATNHFVDPFWGFAPIALDDQDPAYTAHRRANLLALGEKYKGKLNPKVMMEIMSIPLEKGGAFRAPNVTSYQIVAVPKELKVWVRAPEVQEWTEVDLKPLFSTK